MASYHRSSQTTSRTRPATWVPRRVFYVLRYLQRQLTPGKPKAISNKRIQEAIGFGSEGEVSQIMRWLSGELPTAGRWAYGVLRDNAQRSQFIARERMPNGGYLITLLPSPIPLAPPIEPPPEIVQLSFLDDPPMIPPAPHSDAQRGGSFSDMADRAAIHPRPARANARSARDHDKDSSEDQQQQRAAALETDRLYQRLMADGDMNEALARRVVANAPGTLAEFEADLAAVPHGTRTPLFWLAKIWESGKRPRPRDTAPRHASAHRASPAYYTPAPRACLSTEERQALAAQYSPFGGTP